MENEWKELKKDDLPPDVLTGDYEFEFYSESIGKWMRAGRFDTDKEMRMWLINGIIFEHVKYRYRRP